MYRNAYDADVLARSRDNFYY